MLLLFYLYLVSQLDSASFAKRTAKLKASSKVWMKPINWNLSYYSEPFKPCKTLRKFNPVEQAKAHGVATEVFRKCGPNFIVPYAIKYKLPAFAIMKAGEMLCLLFSFGTGYFETNGLPKGSDDALGSRMVALVRRSCWALEKGGWSTTVRQKNESFQFKGYMCREFVVDCLECAIKNVGLRDGDHAKYAIGHFMKMLL